MYIAMKNVDTISDVVEALGGNTALSQKLGLRNASTVSEMKRRGSIPVKYWNALIAEAQHAGVCLTYERLVKMHEPHSSADGEAA